MGITVLTGALTTILILAQVLLIANILGPAVDGSGPAPAWLLPTLAGVLAARVLIVVVQESLAHRAATAVITDLRGQIVDHTVARGPRGGGVPTAEAVTLATRGLDDLAPYFVRYLPQLVLAAVLTPTTLIVLWTQDHTSGYLLAAAIPMIPVFMWLIGTLTRDYSEKRIAQMDRLGAQLLDLLAGIATLKALGRERGPAARVRSLSEAYTATTMNTLRVAFLSGAILEFIASLSVALVAVVIGMRLVFGDVTLVAGLVAIMLAPEVLMPLRQVGTHFHASTNGIAAASAAFEILEQPAPQPGTLPAPSLASTAIELRDASVRPEGRGIEAPSGLTGTFTPGSLTVLVGATGSGKSTTALLVLGLLRPDVGEVTLGGVPVTDLDPASYHSQITWVPQRPALLPGTVLQNVAPELLEPTPELESAAESADFLRVVHSLPEGWNTPLGHGGVGLSVGQRQRLALARALYSPSPFVLLDEPTAHLDSASEAVVVGAARTLVDAGSTVLVIAHRPAMIAAGDHVIEVHSRALAEEVGS